MTEAEWAASESPQKMREHLECVVVSERKLRLFASACCRRVERWFIDTCQRTAVDTLERFADGLASAVELAAASNETDRFDELHDALNEAHSEGNRDALDAAYESARAVAQATSNDASGEGEPTYYHRLYDTIMHTVDAAGYGAVAADRVDGRALLAQAHERQTLAALLRDIFGNPFRPTELDPAWLTSDVLAIARQMYEARDFGAMPILADALQDAGCDNPDVLTHCRRDGPHVCGCWVVDLLLGKA